MVKPSDTTELNDLVAAAKSHWVDGRLAEAEACYRAALELVPTHAGVLHNIGVVVAARGQHATAIEIFDRAIAAVPDYAAAHYNRAVALDGTGRWREAIAGFTRTVALDPGHYDAHRALGFLWLAQHDRGRALDHFARTSELRRGEDQSGMARQSLTCASPLKLGHDAAQFRHLAARRREQRRVEQATRFEQMARTYEEVARQLPQGIARLSGAQLDQLGQDYNCAIHIAAAPEIAGPAINPALDRASIVAGFKAHACGALAVDGLLTPPALAGLRRYLLDSTIWHDFGHIDAFVASYLEDGLACPLLLQIADEIRGALPELLDAHPLSQAWAFKGLEARATVEAHADDAAISVNLWLTPDAANLAPAGGGLTVCRVEPPAHWRIKGYDADKAEVLAFMQRHGSDALVVPYAENRAVLFQSRLFHGSDAPHFAAGYDNHRINLTLLYGRRTR